MGYVSRKGRRPNEFASKSSHSYIINDNTVEDYLHKCSLPKTADEVDIDYKGVELLTQLEINPIKSIITIDGGYTQVIVRKEFPSATIAFFQFGALIFNVSDLDDLGKKSFIEPSDISKLKQIERLKLVLPIKNINLKEESSLINSVRRTIFDFFSKQPKDDSFIETLRWFVFEEYNTPKDKYTLANCPSCENPKIELYKKHLKDYIFKCPVCNADIYLTDAFRLHEAIDNDLGAGGILGYVTTAFEQIILVHIIRLILKTKPNLLNEIFFIKDGPLAFFGQTANMYKPMRKLISFLFNKYNIYLAGLEKSGPFVEHADEISKKMIPGQILLLDNEYIYKYIIPGKADPSNPYGRTTYYGNKLIFKSYDECIYVVSLPTIETLADPKREDFKNLDCTLLNIQKLRCDMYDSSLIPVALVNKLVSLANHPSSIILEKFAKNKLS